jgi:BirA family biotin operon repressor/biotin-[acetyl-CoA-carboxylase] ligase
MPDTLATEAVVPLLRGRFGVPYIYAVSCESTQRLLDEDLPEGATAICEHQTIGRGRLGRRWEAPPGTSILCSVLLHPPAGRDVSELSLVGGLAAAWTIARTLEQAAALKWPNDVLVAGQKVAGVLGETRDGVVVLGIGVNVNQRPEDLPARSQLPAASLRSLDGNERTRAPLLAELLLDLETVYERWLEGGLGLLSDELSKLDYLCGRPVSVDGRSGIARGIAPDGRLVLEAADGRHLVASGEVRIEQAP